MWKKKLDSSGHKTWLGLSVFSIIFGPEDLHRQEEIVPVFKIHAGTGHAASCRHTNNGVVRFHLCGASSTEGHSHEDKGAIILEAFGESLLIDRGTPVYSDPMLHKYKMARLHNLVTIADIHGVEQGQVNPCPGEVLPSGIGNETSFSLEVDTIPAWDKPVVKALRKVDSPDPVHFQITDDIELEETKSVIFHLHSYYPITLKEKMAEFVTPKTRLQVEWDWAGEVIHAREELCDGLNRPVYHLAVKSDPGTTHHLKTRLTLLSS